MRRCAIVGLMSLMVSVLLIALVPTDAVSDGLCGSFFVYPTTGTVTAANLNGNIAQASTTNSTPQCVQGDSSSLTQMRATVDPYPSQSESLALSLEGELQRLRFVIKNAFGWSQWYISNSVLAYGATGDGTTDDSPAFKLAIASGRNVYVPKPTTRYAMASQLTLSTEGQEFICEDNLATELRATAAINMVNITAARVRIEGCYFNGNNVGTSGITFSNAARSHIVRTRVRNMTGDGFLFDQGNASTGGSMVGKNNNIVKMFNTLASNNAGWGIKVAGNRSQTDNNQGHIIGHESTSNTLGGLLIKGNYWIVDGGVYQTSSAGPGIQISQSTDNGNSVGSRILLPDLESNFLAGALSGGKGTRNEWVTICCTSGDTLSQTSGSSDTQISTLGVTRGTYRIGDDIAHVIFEAVASFSGTDPAMRLTAAPGPNTSPTNASLVLAPTGTGSVYLSSFSTCSTNCPQVNSTGRIAHRIFQAFADGDATPDVSIGNLFTTANTSATSITNFSSGKNGQVIIVRTNDVNTTFVDGATIKMSATTNFAAGTNVRLTFVRDASVWYEVSRTSP